ncbi:MAG: hypothetical protein AB2693_34055, partial [Candidatus Thiodiazotropha sp.]
RSVSIDHSYVAAVTNSHDTDEDGSKICPVCTKEVTDSDRALSCCKCKARKHIGCIKMSNNVFKVLSKEPSVMWFCPDNCIKDAESLFSEPDSAKLTALNSKVDLLLKNFNDFKLNQENKEDILDKKIENKVKEMLQEEKEIEKRKCNLLLFKVPEAAEDAENDLTNDLLYVQDVLQELKVETDVSGVIRHGKKMKDKCRPLQITVPDVEVKSKILKSGKLLKKSRDENIKKIFISPDRTPKQRKELKAMLAEVVKRREDGENVAIVDDKIKTFPARRDARKGGPPDRRSMPSAE